MVFLLQQPEQTKKEQMWLTPLLLPSFSLESRLDVQSSENYFLTMKYITRGLRVLAWTLMPSLPISKFLAVREKKKKKIREGISWQSSGQDSVLLLQGTWVRSLVGEVRSYKLRSRAKRKKRQPENHGANMTFKITQANLC